ncbi:hypothetical protein MSAN_00196300 [Mycena sanguinolenta]|uniref:Uncharacterized protein n=1 Tax=Mycena sanguinolenta TaxID=230812 RepID=A0A8H6ZEV5_9AGAR|nr:hypothetical protein MSAN_00196300 [Mycena sanguinolenta]
MFKSLALFALLNAVFVSSTTIQRAPAAAAVASAANVSPAPDAVQVLETCINANINNCLIWSATTLPVGCTNLAANGQASDVSSVSTSAGVECTLFTSTTCTGSSQIINGTINDLSVVAFNDVANSFTCQSN